MNKTGLTLTAALAALVVFCGTASAQNVDGFLDRFKAVLAEQGTQITWTEVEQYDGDDGEPVIGLNDVTVSAGGGGATFDLVELHNVTEDGDGWRVDSVYVPEFSKTQDGTTVHASEIELDGMTISAEGQQNAFGTTMFYEGGRLGAVEVSNEAGTQVMTLDNFVVDTKFPENDEPIHFTGTADGFTANLDAAKDPKTKAVAAALGYSQLAGSLAMAGDWQMQEGLLDLTQMDITVDNAGTFGLSLEIGGYTPEFIASMRETQARLMANPGDKSASGLAMMGMMQQLTFRSARIHFDDDTLTNKVLGFVGKQQGGARAKDVANQAKAMVPFMMMQLGNAELTAMATKAVSTFLDNPQSLVIVAEPPAPVPFALIMAGAMSAPQALPQQLGVKITANE